MKINCAEKKAWAKEIDFDQWLKKVLKVLAKEKKMPINKSAEIELKFVDAEEIKSLNKEFRGVDKQTDVLSFAFLGELSFPGNDLVGQIFLCPEIAKKQAKDHGVSFKEEVEFLFVHALLHIFGWDHEEKADFKAMFKLQLKLFPQIKWREYVDQIYREYFEKEQI